VSEPQDIPLHVLYRDDEVVVIDKPAGLVVHPGAGNPDRTLVNALLHHFPELAALPRAGVVHRLDKDTSGVLVVARSESARRCLVDALKAREVKREYLAVVRGVVIAGGTVDAGIGRHRSDRLRMSVSERGRPAVTHYRVAARYRAHTLLAVQLETGRTHQIRVHLAYIGHPIVGDPLYGGRLSIPAGARDRLATVLHGFRRQALHARRLSFAHPVSGRKMTFDSEPPPDMRELIAALADDAAAGEASV
jgi:23S rRNA pseudouridine1911/1915/1917 synthase